MAMMEIVLLSYIRIDFRVFFGPTRLTLIEFPVRLTNQPCVLNDCGLKLEKSRRSLNGIRSDLRYASTEIYANQITMLGVIADFDVKTMRLYRF